MDSIDYFGSADHKKVGIGKMYEAIIGKRKIRKSFKNCETLDNVRFCLGKPYKFCFKRKAEDQKSQI